MRHLTNDEIERFRTEYRDTEREVQKNIAVYLSALVLAIGWIIGPQAKSFDEMMLGNGGRNIYALLAIICVNIIFSCFLAQKSVVIHEITQFVFHQAPKDAPVLDWESWRRSPLSLSRRVRFAYTATITALPIFVSIALMSIVWSYAWGSPQDLLGRLSAQQPLQARIHQTAANSTLFLTVDVNSLSAILRHARYVWGAVAAFHILPIWFFIVSAYIGKTQWSELFHRRPGITSFQKGDQEEFSDPPPSVTFVALIDQRPAEGTVPDSAFSNE